MRKNYTVARESKSAGTEASNQQVALGSPYRGNCDFLFFNFPFPIVKNIIIVNIIPSIYNPLNPCTANPNLASGGSVRPSRGGGSVGSRSNDTQSMVLNEDMIRVRQAELVILKEEEKFGKLSRYNTQNLHPKSVITCCLFIFFTPKLHPKPGITFFDFSPSPKLGLIYSRDPTGKIVPSLQAETRTVFYEMQKDHRRPIDQPAASRSNIVSLHADRGGVGVAEQPWQPEDVTQRLTLNYFTPKLSQLKPKMYPKTVTT